MVGTRDAACQHKPRSDFAGGVRQIEDAVLPFDDGALRAQGVDLLGLNVDTEKTANIRGYVTGKRVTYPTLVGGVAAIEQIYATDELSVPLTILVDEKGIVQDLIPGWSPQTQKKFAALAGDAKIAEGIREKTSEKPK